MPIDIDFLDVAKLDTQLALLDTKIDAATTIITASQSAQLLKKRQRQRFRDQKRYLVDLKKKIQGINN